MIAQNQTSLLSEVRGQLNLIGYKDDLLREDYVFDDVYSSDRALHIPLAAFAQFPPSYRNACIGILAANGNSGPEYVSEYRALGAPMFFEISQDHIKRYRVNFSGAEFIELIKGNDIQNAFAENKKKWAPVTIFRAKSIIPSIQSVQLDFVDLGLLPALKGMIDKKLDRLLDKILNEAIIIYKKNSQGMTPDFKRLFRLVFRYLAAKIFHDRGHHGNWGNPNASIIIDQINEFYRLPDGEDRDIVNDLDTRQIVWDRFRNAFNFQNLSVDDLAFIYENTLVQKSTRKQFGVHGTPPEIASLLVNHLPFESLPQDGRYVLEPCAGHGVFLVASLARLRDLLPSSWSALQRHEYFRKRLTAIEIDVFASEVCRLCLMLADYPNPNGWNIIPDDVFGSNSLEEQLKISQIVLCNPPFEDFTRDERTHYGNMIESPHKPYEVLRRILKNPPEMLGYILPKSAILGRGYRDLQDSIARTYKFIETVMLPDSIFDHSDQETVLLIASDRNREKNAEVTIKTFWVSGKDKSLLFETGKLPERVNETVNRSVKTEYIPIWNPPLSDIWDYLKNYPQLGQIADCHRGIEWNIPLRENRQKLISDSPRIGFNKGLDTPSHKIEPYYVRNVLYLNMAEEYRRTNNHFLHWEKPKVIVNKSRIRRSPWRIVACPDTDGIVCYQSFIVIWPKANINVEVLSALINSPLLNVVLYLKGYGRDNTINTLAKLPIPLVKNIETDRITLLVRNYIKFRAMFGQDLVNRDITKTCSDILMETDALILKAYDLPPRLEKKVLDFFRGYKRPVFFNFPDYFPLGFNPCIPLYKYLQMDLTKASAGELLKKFKLLDSPTIHQFVMDFIKR